MRMPRLRWLRGPLRLLLWALILLPSVALLLGAAAVSLRFVIFSTACLSETPEARLGLCFQGTGATLQVFVANGAGAYVATSSAATPTLEQVKTAGRFITSASTANPVTICNSGGADCTGVARWDVFISAGGVPSLIAYDASGNPISQSFGAYDGSNFVFFIGNGAGGTSSCLTITPAGLSTWATGTESCGVTAGDQTFNDDLNVLGTLQGLTTVVTVSADTTTLTTDPHCGGVIVSNVDGADALDITLMPASAGCKFCVLATTTEVITVDTADGTDTITLCQSGTCTALTAGNAVDFAGVVGTMGCFLGLSNSSFYLYMQFNTAADGGAD